MEIVTLAFAIFLSVAALWAEHYSPWAKWSGRELSRTQAYILGVLAIILPLTGLWIIWAFEPPGGNPFAWVLGSLWGDVIASGLTVLWLYSLDDKHAAQERAEVAEAGEKVWRRDDAHE